MKSNQPNNQCEKCKKTPDTLVSVGKQILCRDCVPDKYKKETFHGAADYPPSYEPKKIKKKKPMKTELQKLVDKQAEDELIWFQAETAPEAYLQNEIRKLHALIENDKIINIL